MRTLVFTTLAAGWLGAGFFIGLLVSDTLNGVKLPLGKSDYRAPPWRGDPTGTPAAWRLRV